MSAAAPLLRVEAPTDAQLAPAASGVYLLHIEPGYKHARHYLGFSDNIASRVREHREVPTKASPLLQAAYRAGCAVLLTRVWLGLGRNDERRFKNSAHSALLCPRCREAALTHRREARRRRDAARRSPWEDYPDGSPLPAGHEAPEAPEPWLA